MNGENVFILITCFYSCTLFIILSPHVLFDKLKEFRIRAKKVTTALLIICPAVNGNREHLPCILRILFSLKEKEKKRLADVRRLPLARCINLLLLDQVDYNK